MAESGFVSWILTKDNLNLSVADDFMLRAHASFNTLTQLKM
jgi:hypothetical protein